MGLLFLFEFFLQAPLRLGGLGFLPEALAIGGGLGKQIERVPADAREFKLRWLVFGFHSRRMQRGGEGVRLNEHPGEEANGLPVSRDMADQFSELRAFAENYAAS